MGDPKRFHKKYISPSHPWIGSKIEADDKIVSAYGLKNKKELLKAEYKLGKFRDIAKQLVGSKSAQAEKDILIGKLARLGIVQKDTSLEDVLAIELRDILERRFQTLLFKKGIAKTQREARQMILHRQVKLAGRVHTSPGTLVKASEEDTIEYIGPSRIPKQASPELEAKVEAKHETK